ncbi:MAG: acyl-CoA dehydrogenase family protein, partial [Actinomycetota bacterium]|nr:acyl-CoA dehydrogenase family protein [Actinomycetota bacterium]
MFEWSDEQVMVRDAIRRFIDEEIKPHLDELEHGDLPPYDIIRTMYATFGMDAMAKDRFARQLERRRAGDGASAPSERSGDGGSAAMTLIPIIELCRYCPGIVTAMGVSVGLAAGTVM